MAVLASPWQQVNHSLRRTRGALTRAPLFPLVIIGLLTFAAAFADLIMPHDPYDVVLQNTFMPPFWQSGGSLSHPLGTDAVGRDILSRLILGARTSLIASLTAILLGGGAGTALGMVAGYFGKRVDSVIMRVADSMMAFPTILLALFLAVVLGPTFQTVIAVIALVVWARFARLARGEVLSVKARDFVLLAKLTGCSHVRIILHHIFPNVLNTTVVMATLQVGYVIILEASLSFLGAGIPPPAPSWGGMVAEGREYLVTAWWIAALPGFAILLSVMAVNLLGDWIRDALDPKLRQI